MTVNNSTWCNTASGTFLCVLLNLSTEDILKTILLAMIGAVVSFTVSLILKIFIRRHKK